MQESGNYMHNYRPISFLSFFSNILEKLICNMLISFVVRNGIVTEIQNRFKEGKKDQLRQQYSPILKVNRRPLKKVKAS
jgi:hypothetical protein